MAVFTETLGAFSDKFFSLRRHHYEKPYVQEIWIPARGFSQLYSLENIYFSQFYSLENIGYKKLATAYYNKLATEIREVLCADHPT